MFRKTRVAYVCTVADVAGRGIMRGWVLTAVAVICASVPTLPARAADDAPQQTGAFLSYCKANTKGCVDKIADINFAMRVTSPIDHKWCPAKEADDVNVLAPKVVQWLTAHPETNSKKTSEGIGLALAHFYPCKR
jgi:Ssp1 endopeptidase immunity protein Rap1a